MATQYTSLLGLALPVTGELSGSWGATVNTAITSLLDEAVAGTTSITVDADITLTTTVGVANQSRQAIILWNPASGTVTRNITAPAQSKIYTVINASGGTQSIVFRGAGPTTGVTIVKGESAVVAWNGTDFIKISNAGGAASFTNVTVSGTTTLSGLTASTALALDASKNVVSVTNTGTGDNVLSNSPTLVTPALGTPASGVVTNLTGTASININGTVGATTANTGAFTTLTTSSTVTLNGGTANGVAYLNGSKVLTTGSALTFDGSRLTIGGVSAGAAALLIPAGDILADVSSGAFAVGNYGDSSSELRLSTRGFTAFRTGATDGTNGSEQMRLTSTGLGIGTSSPSSKLQVVSNVTSSYGAIIYNQNATGQGLTVRGGSTSSQDAFNVQTYDGGLSLFSVQGGGNVGIGTSSPAVKLDVIGGIKATIASTASNNLRVGNSGSNFYFATENSAGGSFCVGSLAYSGLLVSDNAIQLSTTNGASVQATLNTSGNLGLGVTPSAWFSGLKALQFGAAGVLWSNSDRANFASNVYIDSGTVARYINTGFALRYAQETGQHAWFVAPSGTAGDTISFTQAMTLTAAGDLGLGTTSPVTSAGGGITVGTTSSGKNISIISSSNGNNGLLRFFASSGTEEGQIYSGAGTLTVYANSVLRFSNSGGEAARIDSSGNFGIGTTTSSFIAANRTVFAIGSGANGSLIDFQVSGSTSEGYIYFDGTNATIENSNAGYVRFNTNAAERARITSGGDFGIGTTAPQAPFGGRALQVGNTGDARSLLTLQSTTTGQTSIYFSDGTTGGDTYVGFIDYYHNSDYMAFGTGATERARIDSSGTFSLRDAPASNALQFWTSGSERARMGINASNGLDFAVGSTSPRMTLDSSGVLLVGLASATGVALLQVSGPIRTTGYTVATLPAGTVGMRTYVTDALAPSFGVAVAGSGAVTIPVFYDGANWIVA